MHIVVWRGFVLSLFLLFSNFRPVIHFYFIFYFLARPGVGRWSEYVPDHPDLDRFSEIRFLLNNVTAIFASSIRQSTVVRATWLNFVFFFPFWTIVGNLFADRFRPIVGIFFPSGQNSADYLKYRSKTKLSDFR